tara:strand:- start:415 stop:612 length:198 start_codon:yes stop_codon:yes gene_type:complete
MSKTQQKLMAIIEMAQATLHGIKTDTIKITPETEAEVGEAYRALISGFDEGEVIYAVEVITSKAN